MNNNRKKPREQIADVPDPAVPNRAHTEMKVNNKSDEKKDKPECDNDKCEIMFEKKKK